MMPADDDYAFQLALAQLRTAVEFVRRTLAQVGDADPTRTVQAALQWLALAPPDD